MKKTFLIFGIIGAIYASGGYAGDNQSVVVYTCPDECSVNEDITNCVYADGSDCGVFSTDVFVPQTVGQISGITSKSPRDSGSVSVSRSATEQPVAARAAVARPRANTSKPSAKPTGPDKAMGQSGSGAGYMLCPSDKCEWYHDTLSDGTEFMDCIKRGTSANPQPCPSASQGASLR